jgi:hypothetical protein
MSFLMLVGLLLGLLLGVGLFCRFRPRLRLRLLHVCLSNRRTDANSRRVRVRRSSRNIATDRAFECRSGRHIDHLDLLSTATAVVVVVVTFIVIGIEKVHQIIEITLLTADAVRVRVRVYHSPESKGVSSG